MLNLRPVILLLCLALLATCQYNTNPERSDGLQKLCVDQNLDRDSLLDE